MHTEGHPDPALPSVWRWGGANCVPRSWLQADINADRQFIPNVGFLQTHVPGLPRIYRI